MPRLGVASFMLLFAALSCAPSALRTVPPTGMAGSLVWPSPPERPRIQFVATIQRPRELLGPARSRSMWRELLERMAGASAVEVFVRPSSIAAQDGVVAVADPGAPSVWIADQRQGRLRRISAVGRQRLVSPVAVALGRGGRLVVADSSLSRVFVCDLRGRLQRVLQSPDMRRPAGVALDEARRRVYVADSAAHCIWIFDDDGAVTGVIGRRGSAPGAFNFPTHVAVGPDGALYVADTLGFRVQVFDPSGGLRSWFGRQGDASGDFARPKGVALDPDGHLYVVDALFDAVQIFDPSGALLLAFGRHGSDPGEFWLANGLTIDGTQIYVADSYNRRIQHFTYLGAPAAHAQ